jgi:hypothetical protein
MINEILAGIVAGSGWLIGIPLYKYTKEEIDPLVKKLKITFTQGIILAIILPASLFIQSLMQFSYEINLIAIFICSLVISSLYTKNSKHQILLFLIHVIILLVSFFVTQSF